MVDKAGEEEVGDGCCSSEIRAGDVFVSYEEFEMKLNTYKQDRFVAFWKRDCRTIAAEVLRHKVLLCSRWKNF